MHTLWAVVMFVMVEMAILCLYNCEWNVIPHCLINSYSLITGLPLIFSLYSGSLISIMTLNEACFIDCINSWRCGELVKGRAPTLIVFLCFLLVVSNMNEGDYTRKGQMGGTRVHRHKMM
jgi:hypothetical protein